LSPTIDEPDAKRSAASEGAWGGADDDAAHKVQQVLAKLAEWAPRADACEVVAQNPDLVQRVSQHYMQTDSTSLPISIQNLLTQGGAGGGGLWRDWSSQWNDAR
jgi:hypothetical protein